MATSNPVMNPAIYEREGFADSRTQAMTVQGSVLKASILVVVLTTVAAMTWTQAKSGVSNIASLLLIVGSIGGLVVALITAFKPKWSPITAPIYAVLQGLVLGAFSAYFETAYPGIVVQAIGLSIGVLAIMLFLYGTRIIRATEKFKIGLIAATGAICLVYLVSMVMSLFGARIPYIHESGAIGIGFSVVVVIIASLNLILDFDFIEQGARKNAPKYMEWYAGFSLLVTLVWMYLEILRLLAKLRGNSRD